MKTVTVPVPVEILAQALTALRLASAVCIVHSPTIHERTRAAEQALGAAVETASRRK